MNTALFEKTARHPRVFRAQTHERTSVIRLMQLEHRTIVTLLHECRILLSAGDTAFAYVLALEASEEIQRHLRMDARVIRHYARDALHLETFNRRQRIDLQMQQLLSDLQGWNQSDDAEGRSNFQALVHLFYQHVKLEEGPIIHQLACADLDWAQLQRDFLQCKEELSKEVIVVADNMTC
ncbi:MAG TPA: hemerythrin domain-containing protein [Aquabacterium sp.]|uniref:hemerythrin domain-containing protein n=1 Tax=Aquabacterium sp. TaxID=1872578 RepID=UPI002E30E998|nr:hemerythrin domain-containing protein [Aquabacterium sp.]HEX5357940.1 hemerythrin domain-containing protein [Aquabacterium sp.]